MQQEIICDIMVVSLNRFGKSVRKAPDLAAGITGHICGPGMDAGRLAQKIVRRV